MLTGRLRHDGILFSGDVSATSSGTQTGAAIDIHRKAGRSGRSTQQSHSWWRWAAPWAKRSRRGGRTVSLQVRSSITASSRKAVGVPIQRRSLCAVLVAPVVL